MPKPARRNRRKTDTSRNKPLVSPALAERLKNYRVKNDLPYKTIAYLIGGVSLETVRRIELGTARPTVRTLAKVESFLSRMEDSNRAA